MQPRPPPNLNDFIRISFLSTRSRAPSRRRDGPTLGKAPRPGKADGLRKNGSTRRAAATRGEAPGQDLVDAAAVEIDDLEAPALVVEAFADGRQIPELT